MQNIEIERKYFIPYELDEVPGTIKEFDSICHDRYYYAPTGLIRLRDDREKGIEITAKTYGENNIHRREINLGLENHIDIKDCLEFAEVAGWTLRLEFKQILKIWITPEVVVSQTHIVDPELKAYRFNRSDNFLTKHHAFPIARFVEIEALDSSDKTDAIASVTNCERLLGLTKRDCIKYSLIQLFGAYPMNSSRKK